MIPEPSVDSHEERAVNEIHTAGESSETPVPRAIETAPVGVDQLIGMRSDLELLKSVVSEEVRLGRDRERVVDHLLRENQSLRSGELDRAIAPILRDLVRLSDDLTVAAKRFRDSPEGGCGLFARELDSFGDSVVDILYRQGCEPFAPEAGERFDAKAHRPSSVRDTHDSVKDACVEEVMKKGFRHNGKLLRPAVVVVSRYCPAASAPGPPGGDGGAPAEPAAE